MLRSTQTRRPCSWVLIPAEPSINRTYTAIWYSKRALRVAQHRSRVGEDRKCFYVGFRNCRVCEVDCADSCPLNVRASHASRRINKSESAECAVLGGPIQCERQGRFQDSMSICKYCGEKAGWFNDVHEHCIRNAQEGCAKASSLILRGHLKTGQRWSGQNRPTEVAGD